MTYIYKFKCNKRLCQRKLVRDISLLLIFFIFVFTFIGCSNIADKTDTNKKGIELNDYTEVNNWDNINLYTPFSMNTHNNELVLKFADRIMEGYFVVEDSFYDDAIQFDANQIDWNMQVTESPNTFSLWLHSLNPIYYLANAYVQSGNIEYMNLAENILSSWLQYNDKSKLKNRYTWYDHSVAVRTENLIYYTLLYESISGSKSEKLRDVINEHAEWLMKESNYVLNHNHGIFEDGALIKCGYFLEKQGYIDIGIERLDKQLQYAYPNKAVHIENSTGYHIGLLTYLKQVALFLSAVNDSYFNTVNEYYSGALEFLVYAYQPNLALPPVGDTYGTDISSREFIDDYDNDFLRYISTKGKEGRQPEETLKIFKNDGYAFIRESWDSKSYEESTWLMFKSGFNSITHKHKDDLSIALYSKGYDIFIDPGMYNYMVGNKMHDYLNSNFAHNTIIVDDKPYPIAKNINEKAGILDYKTTEQYTYVRGYNNLYETVLIDRTVVYVNEDTILLVDDIVSDELHKYTQNFHLSDQMKIIEKNKDRVLLQIADSKWFVLIRQFGDVIDNLEVVQGLGDTITDSSIRSVGLGKIKETASLRFNIRGENTKFITLIQILDERGLQNFIEPRVAINDSQLTYNNIVVDIASRKRLIKTEVSAHVNGNSILLDHNENVYGQSYCYYIIDAESKKTINKSDYSLESQYSFKLPEKGEYAVISYIKNNYGERIKYLAGFLKFNNGKYVYKATPLNQSVPYVINEKMKQLSEKEYLFEIETIGFNDLTVSWYIYKNGASYDYIKSGNAITYKFTEPGTYTCIYRAYDKYFYEVTMNNFTEIDIE